jgi:hypothetical protein
VPGQDGIGDRLGGGDGPALELVQDGPPDLFGDDAEASGQGLDLLGEGIPS